MDRRQFLARSAALAAAASVPATSLADETMRTRTIPGTSEELPVIGRKDIALNWDGTPALLVETLEVTHKRFCDVDERFALDDGENEDLDGWRRGHQEYFERHGKFDREMMLVCERFRLVHDYES